MDDEDRLATVFDALGDRVTVLRDRLVPGSRAVIDHTVVGPAAVWTVAEVNLAGRIEVRRKTLRVGGRQRSELIDRARRQRAVVERMLLEAGLGHVRVTPVLCFVSARWPFVLPPRSAGGVRLASPRTLRPLVTSGRSELPPDELSWIVRTLDVGLKPAPPGPRSAEPPPGVPVVTEWRRSGKHRCYVESPDGTTLGYVDLQSNEVVSEDPSYRDLVVGAVARHLRER